MKIISLMRFNAAVIAVLVLSLIMVFSATTVMADTHADAPSESNCDQAVDGEQDCGGTADPTSSPTELDPEQSLGISGDPIPELSTLLDVDPAKLSSFEKIVKEMGGLEATNFQDLVDLAGLQGFDIAGVSEDVLGGLSQSGLSGAEDNNKDAFRSGLGGNLTPGIPSGDSLVSQDSGQFGTETYYYTRGGRNVDYVVYSTDTGKVVAYGVVHFNDDGSATVIRVDTTTKPHHTTSTSVESPDGKSGNSGKPSGGSSREDSKKPADESGTSGEDPKKPADDGKSSGEEVGNPSDGGEQGEGPEEPVEVDSYQPASPDDSPSAGTGGCAAPIEYYCQMPGQEGVLEEIREQAQASSDGGYQLIDPDMPITNPDPTTSGISGLLENDAALLEGMEMSRDCVPEYSPPDCEPPTAGGQLEPTAGAMIAFGQG